jgi:hypothetical protein
MLMRLLPLLACALLSLAQTSRPPDIPFRIHAIDMGASETAAVADIDRDGRLDIVSGDSWYQAPRWTKHTFRQLGFSNNYIDAFSDLALDVDEDGFPDLVTVTWFSRKISWYRNPGHSRGTSAGAPGTRTEESWPEAVISSGFNVEFAVLADIDNDGRPREVVAQENGTGQAWYEVRDGAWIRHVVSDRSYSHGIGAGDVNGDRRTDILTPRGWLEAPADPRSGGWPYHAAWEAVNTPITPREPPPGAAPKTTPPRVAELGFMHVLDVNRDGRNDIVTAAGHDFGVFWFEHGEDGRWTRRAIDQTWSQGHATTLADLTGDGRVDVITGKRYLAHNGSDPGEREPLGVYWYEFRPLVPSAAGNGERRAPGAGVEWIRHLVDYGGRMGGGMQIPVVDVDGDGDLDLVCPGKSGLFLVENLTKGMDRPPTKPGPVNNIDKGQR